MALDVNRSPRAGGRASPIADRSIQASERGGIKRYNLALPEELFDELQELADRKHTTVVEMLRRFIKLGLIASSVEGTPGKALIIREGDREREIVLL